MITIVDYGMGNLRSVQKAFELFSPNVRISSSAKDILDSEKIVLPGVGAFGKAMEEIKKRNLAQCIKQFVKEGKPFFGKRRRRKSKRSGCLGRGSEKI